MIRIPETAEVFAPVLKMLTPGQALQKQEPLDLLPVITEASRSLRQEKADLGETKEFKRRCREISNLHEEHFQELIEEENK